MNKPLIRFWGTFFLFILLFVVQRLIFMFYYHKFYIDVPGTEYMKIIGYGIIPDLSTAGYLTVIPGILLILSLWIVPQVINPIFRFYYGVVSILLSVIFTADLILYGHWGSRLDSTPIAYFLYSPKVILTGATPTEIIAGITGSLVLAFLIYLLFTRMLIQKEKKYMVNRSRSKSSVLLMICTGLLFIPFGRIFALYPVNMIHTYESHNKYLNHTTINPALNLLKSLKHDNNFADRFRFMDPAEAEEIVSRMVEKPELNDSLHTDKKFPVLFTTERPNVIFVVLESFMAGIMESLGGLPDVAVNMDKYAEEGILFTNFFANSSRTDHGLVSIFSAYPGQPATGVRNHPKKLITIPSLPQSLKKTGYTVDYYYGRDTEFTNMNSYLLSLGMDQIICDKDFPVSERLSKGGVHNHLVFNRLIEDLLTHEQQEPFMKIIHTSGGHEPFNVPYHRFEDSFLNSVAYTDSCLADFVNKFKETEWWDNSIFILAGDHAKGFPKHNTGEYDPARFHIPLVFVGGALAVGSTRIDTYASQIDIAATLLSQLGLPHSEFIFSKNIVNPVSPHFGYVIFPNAFGMFTADNRLIYDFNVDKILLNVGKNPGENLLPGKAFLQKLFNE